MSKQDLKALRELSETDLLDAIQEAKAEMFKMKMQWAATRQLNNPAGLRDLKKKVSRIKTILREREIEGEFSHV